MADNINQTLEDLRAAIAENTTKQGQCCQPKGSKTGSEPSTQAPQYGGIDDEYESQEAFFDARCNSANGVYDTLLELVQWLDDNHVDLKAGLFGSITVGLVLGALASGPAGWALAGSGWIVSSIAIWLIRETMDFGVLASAMDDVHEELVKALYNASSVTLARANFLFILENATPAPSPPQLFLVQIMLGEDLLNNIFEPRSDMAIYQSEDPISCGDFIIQTWSFVASGDGWAFRDDSTGTYSATGQYVLARQAWEITLIGLGTGTGPDARGTIYLHGLSIAVEVGDSVQLDFTIPSDGVSASKHITVTMADTTVYTQKVTGKTEGTVILTIPAAGTIEKIECWVRRNWSKAFTATVDFPEVRVQ